MKKQKISSGQEFLGSISKNIYEAYSLKLSLCKDVANKYSQLFINYMLRYFNCYDIVAYDSKKELY